MKNFWNVYIHACADTYTQYLGKNTGETMILMFPGRGPEKLEEGVGGRVHHVSCCTSYI